MTTQMVDKSNFDNKQYKADLQCAYDCGYVKGQVDILEKIKAEFEDRILLNQTVAIQIIDKHIAELKGESKE